MFTGIIEEVGSARQVRADGLTGHRETTAYLRAPTLFMRMVSQCFLMNGPRLTAVAKDAIDTPREAWRSAPCAPKSGPRAIQPVAGLPLDRRMVLPDGSRLLAVHGSPGRDDGRGIDPSMSNDEVEEVVAGCQADLICVGHTHEPVDRQVGDFRVVKPRECQQSPRS